MHEYSIDGTCISFTCELFNNNGISYTVTLNLFTAIGKLKELSGSEFVAIYNLYRQLVWLKELILGLTKVTDTGLLCVIKFIIIRGIKSKSLYVV